MKNKKIYFWSPFISPIATCKAVINSATSLKKYSSSYDAYIINFFGEFSKNEKEIKNNSIKLIGHFGNKLINFLPSQGKIKSRLSFLIIFLFGFIPLKKLIKKEKPDYLIIHLITSLPLILLIFFNFNTKFILRISGFPKMNLVRKFIWRLAFKKIYLIPCPTNNTLNYIKELKITDAKKLKLLDDPVLILKEVNLKKKENKVSYQNYFFAAGRLTKQKNFIFLCEAFKKVLEKYKDFKLLIAGVGEDKIKIQQYLIKNNLNNKIILLGQIENIYPYFYNSNGFILTSLWEDPGFVLVEAAYCRTPVLTSNSWPGPLELIKNDFNGIVFKNNSTKDFYEKFSYMINHSNINLIKKNNLKSIKKFTIFDHFLNLNKILN